MNDHVLVLAPGVLVRLGAGDEVTSGIVVAEDGVTVVDAGPTPSVGRTISDEIAELTPTPIKRLVATASHVRHVGGAAGFPMAAIYGRQQTSELLDQPADPAVWAALFPSHASEFADMAVRPVTHTVDVAAHLCPASIAVPMGGVQFENLVVQVPAAGVVFAGALLFGCEVPLGHDADPPVWLESLTRLAELGETFVGADGTIGDASELERAAEFLSACLDAKGDPGALRPGPWREWTRQERIPVLVERAAMLDAGNPDPPPSMLRLIGRG